MRLDCAAQSFGLRRDLSYDRVARLDRVDPERHKLDFLCECGAKDCVGTVKLTPNEYTEFRERGRVLMDGHAA
jgi:hypothetical protein